MKAICDRQHLTLVLTTGLLFLGSPTSTAVGPSTDIRAEHLVEVGLHLPAYMRSLSDLIEYQTRLSVHQELQIVWDSLPGQTEMRPKEQVPLDSLAPNFTLLKQKRMVPGSAGKTHLSPGDGYIVIAAITANKEVRGLRVEADPRVTFSEDLRPGRQGRWDHVYPKGTIYTVLPEDAQVQFLLFYKSEANRNNDGGWRLREVGRLLLPK